MSVRTVCIGNWVYIEVCLLNLDNQKIDLFQNDTGRQ